MESTTTIGVSQAAVSESNRHSSPSPTAKRSSDPTRLSPTALCNICAHGLRLDDRRAGGALKKSRNDGAPSLCFPSPGERKQSFEDFFNWKGGAQYKQRYITPPHLPELSDDCAFCRTVKSALLDQLGRHEWWQTTTTKLTLKVQYEWRGERHEHPVDHLLDFELKTLEVDVKHPELSERWNMSFPITTSSGKLTLKCMKMKLLNFTLDCRLLSRMASYQKEACGYGKRILREERRSDSELGDARRE